MIRVAGTFIEVEGEQPERLASFYEQLFGLERLSESSEAIVLTGVGLHLKVRRALGVGAREGGAVFGFVLADGGNPDAARDEAVAAGAIVLSESKREGAHSLVCQDPAGNEFALVVGAPARGQEALVRADAVPAQEAPAQGAPRALSPRGAPTRRDYDRLRDEERLASMKESIAGLDMAFSPDDPAGVLDEMRSKVGAPAPQSAVDEADALLRAREREVAIDDALRRYREQLADPDPATPTASHAADVEPPEADRPRTLGRSARADDESA